MSTKRRDFTAKARGIVGDRPKSLGEFLENDQLTDSPSAVKPIGQTDTRHKKTGREEFRFEEPLAERLRHCAYETRRKKTAIVREALDDYLKRQGF